jgi:Uma2 family endonuclease
MLGAPKKLGSATIADLLAIPEELRRHEVIDGELVEKEAASGRHGGAQLRLGQTLAPYDRRSGGWWFASETEIQLDVHQVFRPDVAGWRRERLSELPSEVPILVRPDWVCEILSKNRRNDLVKKKRAYHASGVGHDWLVDPLEELLTIYRWHTDGYLEVLVADRSERVRAEPFEAIDLAVGVLFGDDDVEP